MGKYKWNFGMGAFCGLVVVLKKFHADLNGKEKQINKCFLIIDSWKVTECDSLT
jgi:hypothetical protein